MSRLTFTPEFFRQITAGSLVGNWVPVIPSRITERHTIAAYREEMRKIVREGGMVSFAEGGSIGLLKSIETALAAVGK